jgi:hypothetical protein
VFGIDGLLLSETGSSFLYVPAYPRKIAHFEYPIRAILAGLFVRSRSLTRTEDQRASTMLCHFPTAPLAGSGINLDFEME